MAMEIATWALLATFIALTVALVELCEKIVGAVEKRRSR